MKRPTNELSTITRDVPALDAPQRLDAWLARELAAFPNAPSRSRIQALVRGGSATVNDILVSNPKHQLRGGERVALHIPPPEPARPEPEAIPITILYEDEDLLVVVKPVGMVVHPGAGVRSGTLVNAILHHCAEGLSGIGGVARPGIVHRLDRDTSGVMVVAKNDVAHRHLSAQFADHGRTGPLERSYVAIVWGTLRPQVGMIDLSLGRDRRDRTRRAVSDAADARKAVTHYAVHEEFETASLVSCRLETGRTHQIRVHMAEIGHPLLGDRVYGAAYRSKRGTLSSAVCEAFDLLEGQALHAATLRFEHPRTKEVMEFTSSPPDPMRALLEALRNGR